MNRYKLITTVISILVFLFLTFSTNSFQDPQGVLSKKIVVTPTVITSIPSLSPSQATTGASLYPVTKVVDGDTIYVLIDGKKQTIRFIGVDTPEVVDPRKPVQCFGKEASAFTKSLLTGKSVRLEADETQDNKDKYNRLLRYIYLEDGTLVNKELIVQGYAHEYTYEVPYTYQAEFKQAQKTAQLEKKGLWGDNVCPTQ